MSNTAKKIGSVARYGPRYGVRIRSRILEVEKERAKGVPCPQCGTVSVEREAAAIWKCRHCGYKYAARAYVGAARKLVIPSSKGEKETGRERA